MSSTNRGSSNAAPARSTTDIRRFKCHDCPQTFTRIDHLKRHQLRHSGVKPYACIFCQDAFARCDSLRHHYPECALRGTRPIPDTDQKGRRRHSCIVCTSMKLKCVTLDGDSSCTSCRKRRVDCKRPEAVPSSPRVSKHEDQQAMASSSNDGVDGGTVRSLLDGGRHTFLQQMSLPGHQHLPEDRPPSKPQAFAPMAAHGIDAYLPNDPYHTPANVPPFGSTLINESSQYRDAVSSFYGSIFDAYHLGWNESGSSMLRGNDDWSVTHFEAPVACDYPIYSEQHPAVAALITELCLAMARLGLNFQRQQELQADINFLLVPDRCQRFLARYQNLWHPNCPMIHNIAAFTFDSVPPQLLAAVLFMGAMYSFDTHELLAAKTLLDVVESYVFTSDLFSPNADILRTLSGGKPNPSDDSPEHSTDWTDFQVLQAGFLLVIVQHWAGGPAARKRSMEVRFNQIVLVARNMHLTTARHTEAERAHQTLWIQQECRTRTVNLIYSLDCAFVFFHSYPTRMTMAEMQRDLPCDDALFESADPFAEPGFKLSRGLTLRRAYEMMLDDSVDDAEGADLTILDMFLLIHVIYVSISDRLLQRPHFARPATSPLPSRNSASRDSDPDRRPDPAMAPMLAALAKWRRVWDRVRGRTSAQSWARAGLFRDSLRYWLVARLVADRHGLVDVGWLLEIRCGDKLERLQSLTAA